MWKGNFLANMEHTWYTRNDVFSISLVFKWCVYLATQGEHGEEAARSSAGGIQENLTLKILLTMLMMKQIWWVIHCFQNKLLVGMFTKE